MPYKQGAVNRIILSGIILTIFYGALLYDYWPALAPAGLRIFNSARSVGAETMESPFFEVYNNSSASDEQVQELVRALGQQYQAISAYTQTKPESKLQVLVVDGTGPAMVDGSQLVINYDNGLMDTDLAPLFLSIHIQNIPIDPTGGLAPAGGQALHVVEAAGLGDGLIRQPLDDWTVLLRQSSAFLPLEEAWMVTLPSSDDGYYDLMRALLESGSFMGWFTAKYGLDSSQLVARGQTVETVSGKSLKENEVEWLQWLEAQKRTPKSCGEVIAQDSLFYLICRKLPETPNK